jgi:hypothetical protein
VSLAAKTQKALESDVAWFFQEVFEAFAFLQDHGWAVEDVHLDFWEIYVTYVGEKYELTISYEPQPESRVVLCQLVTRIAVPIPLGTIPPNYEQEAICWLLEQRAPDREWLRQAPGTKKGKAIATIRQWARGLQKHAMDVVDGGPLRPQGP